jgi:hypothetical protein
MWCFSAGYHRFPHFSVDTALNMSKYVFYVHCLMLVAWNYIRLLPIMFHWNIHGHSKVSDTINLSSSPSRHGLLNGSWLFLKWLSTEHCLNQNKALVESQWWNFKVALTEMQHLTRRNQGWKKERGWGTWTPRSPRPRIRSPSVTTMTPTSFSGQFFKISSTLPLLTYHNASVLVKWLKTWG